MAQIGHGFRRTLVGLKQDMDDPDAVLEGGFRRTLVGLKHGGKTRR